jgi:hypothetical protein
MRWWLFLLVGCGRVAFEPMVDAQLPTCTGHDEDGDAFPDACDVCPHVADATQADGDGDGVGNACDPTSGNESFAFFDPFIADRSEWTYQAASHSYVSDSLALDSRGDYFFMDRTGAAQNDVFELSGEIVSVDSGLAQITLTFYVGGRPHYYCEFFGDASSAKVAMTYTFDDTIFSTVSETPIAGFAPGPFRLTADHRSPMMRCDGNGAIAEGAIPGGFGTPDRVAIQINGLELRLNYYVQIHTN